MIEDICWKLWWWYMIIKNDMIDWLGYYLFILFLKIIYEIGRQYEIDNLTVLRIPPMEIYTLAIDCPEGLCRQRDQRHVARETSDKPPARPAVPKDMAARWFAAYRKQIRGIMTLPQKKFGHSLWLTKRIEEQKKLKSQKKLEFLKKK